MVLLTVTLLGGFDARLASGASLRLPKKAQALLAYLGVRSGHRQSRDKLATLLWGDKSDQQARDGLRHALAALRRSLGEAFPHMLHLEGQTLALNPDRVEVDVATFERLLAEKTVPALEQAASLYRGDLLLSFTVNEPSFEEWLVAERERLRELAVDGLIRLLDDQTRATATERAIQTAVRLLGLDPLQEGVHRTLMRLYARQGRRGAALKQYQSCVSALRRELGTEPEAETRRLYQDLLRRPVETATDEPREHAGIPSTPGVSSLAIDLPAPETPLFGRVDELKRLRMLLDEAIGGHGHIATVVGEAGIGKTRLVSALATEAGARGCRVLIGHAHESDSILPFGPWVDVCRTGAVVDDEEVLAALHPARRAELARLLPEAGRAGLPRASDGALPLFESVATLVEQLAARRPLMVLLEDVHWADEMSLRLLAFVGRRVARSRALFVLTARDEELPDAPMARRTLEELSRAPGATAIVLPPLSRTDTAELTRALARVGSDPATLARREAQVWAVGEGNPFVTVEVARALDQQSLEANGGVDPGAGVLPARVRDLVSRRLDRLSTRGQELTAVAAVIGRRFDFRLLAAASGTDERDAAQAVEEMVRYRVLQALGHELDFTHERVREVAYNRLLPQRRQILHRAVAEALEAAGRAGGTSEHVELLAHHALRGDLGERAIRYLRQAGERATARSALHEARAWLEQALTVLDTLPASPSMLEEAFEVHLALRPVLSQLREFRRVLELLRGAESIAERLSDEGRRGRVHAFLTNIHARLEDSNEAIASGERALQIARRLDDRKLGILTTTYLAQAHFYRGEFSRVVELAKANLASISPDSTYEFMGNSQPVSVNSRFWLIWSLAHLGRFDEAAKYAEEILALAERTGHAHTISMACEGAGVLHQVRGQWARAHDLFERQLAALRSGNILDNLPAVLADSTRVLAYLGDERAALTRIDESRQLLEIEGRAAVDGQAYVALGVACVRLGLVDEARRLATHAVELASGRVEFLPDALHLHGDVASHPDGFDAERAEAHYREALALAESRGMRPLVAHCHLGLSKLYRRTGKRDDAREHVTTAATMYREMGMRFYLEQAEAEIRE